MSRPTFSASRPLLAVLLLSSLIFADLSGQIRLTGTVVDENRQPVSFANLLLGVNDAAAIHHFTLLEADGTYQLAGSAQTGDTLYLNIRSLGYRDLVDTFILEPHTPLERDYQLRVAAVGLSEFTVSERAPPVIVRGDSTIYDADSFTTGREQNLREVLQKLPGVEVDRNNQVTVNGKVVDRITVENENFFGRSKLALDRLPADVVGKIEVTDHHHDVAFLRNLTEEDELILNVKLQTDRSRFLFGRVRVLANPLPSSRHLLAGDAFYYGPSLKANLLTDANNLNLPPLTFADFLAMDRTGLDAESSLQSYTTFEPFLESRRRTEHRSQFAAGNWHTPLNSHWKLSGYALHADNTGRQQDRQRNRFFDQDGVSLVEHRLVERSDQRQIQRIKTTLEQTPTDRQHLRLEFSGYRTQGDAQTDFQSQFLVRDTLLTDRSDQEQQVDVRLNTNRKFKSNQVGTLDAEWSYQNQRPSSQLMAGTPLLSAFLSPTEQFHNLRQTDHLQSHRFHWRYRHIVPLSRKHHVHFRAAQRFETSAYQFATQPLLATGTPEPPALFDTSGKLRLATHTLHTAYRTKQKNWLLRASMTGKWLRNRTVEQREFHLLPGMRMEWTWIGVAKITGDYQRSAQFPRSPYLLEGSRVIDFNQLESGNPQLRATLHEDASLHLVRSDLLKGRTWYLKLRYHRQLRGVQQQLVGVGIDRRTSYLLALNPLFRWEARTSVAWRRSGWMYRPNVRWMVRHYRPRVEGRPVERRSRRLSAGGTLRGPLGTSADMKVAANVGWNRLSQGTQQRYYIFYDLSLQTTYELRREIFVESSMLLYTQHGKGEAPNLYPDWSATISYRPAERPYWLELRAVNLLGTPFIRENTLTDLAILESETSLFPRAVVLGLGWRF